MEKYKKILKFWFMLFLIPLAGNIVLCVIEWMLQSQQIEYRVWLNVLIGCIFLFLVPVLFLIFLEVVLDVWKSYREKKSISIVASILQLLLIGIGVLYLPVAIFLFLLTYDSTYENEKFIDDTYIEGTTQKFMEATDDVTYAYYTKLSFFAKKKCELNTYLVEQKLEEKYQEAFQVEKAVEQTRLKEEQYSYIAIPEAYPEVKIYVMGLEDAHPFYDNYASQLFQYLTVNYIKEHQMERDYSIENNNDTLNNDTLNNEETANAIYSWLHFSCMGKEDIDTCASDIMRVISYCEENPSFKKNKFSVLCYINLYQNELESAYPDDTNNSDINQQISAIELSINSYGEKLTADSIKEQLKTAYREENQIKNPDMELKDTVTDNSESNVEKETTPESNEGMDNSTPEGAFDTLFNQVFKEKGDTYEPTYNAKGNFYGILEVGSEKVAGETQNYRRTVVYDRESKNGNCLLFVAYKEYTYMDGTPGNTTILNFYAVEKKTGKVVAADKTSWEATGCKEYREMTGE